MSARLQTWEREIAGVVPSVTAYCFDELGSTMDYARELARGGAHGPALVVAARQTAGRGRQGRAWVSEPGGLYATYLIAGQRPLEQFGGFSLAIGCALAAALEPLGVRCGLKWPNDILSEDGRKLCGILIEVIPAPEGAQVLIGIGLNLTQLLSEVADAVSLQTLCGRSLTPPEAATLITPQILKYFGEFMQSGFAGVRDEWLGKAALVGRGIKVDTGARVVEGKVSGVDDYGCLLLETPQGREAISAGHVILA